MLIKSGFRIATFGTALLLLASLIIAGSAFAGITDPSDIDEIQHFLPPTADFPSGLDTRTIVTLPSPSDRDKSKGSAKSNHLPVRPVKRGRMDHGYCDLVSLKQKREKSINHSDERIRRHRYHHKELSTETEVTGSVLPSVRSEVDAILLLVPDSADLSDPRITVWLDASAEEGLHVKPITDSQLMSLGPQVSQYRGLIMPDQVHMNASDELVAAVQYYVSQGGNLMLVYDAGVLTPNGFYSNPKSRLSPLVGVDYALYDQLRDQTIGFGPITAMENTWRDLRVPPGKSMPYPLAAGAVNPIHGLTSYYYGLLNYPSFVTQGTYTGNAYITSPSFGLVSGVNNFGSGRVLFVNTPLGYLKGYGTDGLLLHGFLHYFGVEMLQLPYLSPLPKGVGGMVLNIHTDCGNSLADIQTLENENFWNYGPYSIDITAGPDCTSWDDGKGLNIPGNPAMQNWIDYFVGKGHEVGSHGGWIHDFYGYKVAEDNQNTLIAESGNLYTFQDLLILNKKSIEDVMFPKKVREYSAPLGNTPKWSVSWMEQNGIVGYYWLGDAGMAPTLGYREGQLLNKKIWAHPVTPYGTSATFEEFFANKISVAEATTWVTDLVDFAVQQRTSRLIYFHEPGITGSITGESYLSAIQAMIHQGNGYGRDFKFYTMTRLSDFLLDRQNVSWQADLLTDNGLRINALANPPLESLEEMTWVLPKSRYTKPANLKGVKVVDDISNDEWLVIGLRGVSSAQFTIKPL